MCHPAKKVGPLIMLQVLARITETDSSREVAEEFGIDKSTINRWRAAFLETPNLRDELREARKSIARLMVEA